MPMYPSARLAAASIMVFGLAGPMLGGCSMFGFGGSKPETTATTTPTSSTSPAASADQIDVRQYLGPDYCPEIRVLNGAEVLRRYEKGHEDDAKFIIWQASVGKTARECLFDLQGGMTLKIGVSGRVIAGPKGGAATVPVPLKISVVKYQEAVLVTQDYPIDVAIPAEGATTFTQVKEILLPSPGKNRDYIIYVGFDTGGWDPLHGEAAVAAVEPPRPAAAPPPAAAAPLPTKPTAPKVLPTPSDGFVLPR